MTKAEATALLQRAGDAIRILEALKPTQMNYEKRDEIYKLLREIRDMAAVEMR